MMIGSEQLEVCPSFEAAIESAKIPFWDRSLTTSRSKIAAKSLVLKDFSYKSFKFKDFAGISS
jgi:hypothetical protein